MSKLKNRGPLKIALAAFISEIIFIILLFGLIAFMLQEEIIEMNNMDIYIKSSVFLCVFTVSSTICRFWRREYLKISLISCVPMAVFILVITVFATGNFSYKINGFHSFIAVISACIFSIFVHIGQKSGKRGTKKIRNYK